MHVLIFMGGGGGVNLTAVYGDHTSCHTCAGMWEFRFQSDFRHLCSSQNHHFQTFNALKSTSFQAFQIISDFFSQTLSCTCRYPCMWKHPFTWRIQISIWFQTSLLFTKPKAHLFRHFRLFQTFSDFFSQTLSCTPACESTLLPEAQGNLSKVKSLSHFIRSPLTPQRN